MDISDNYHNILPGKESELGLINDINVILFQERRNIMIKNFPNIKKFLIQNCSIPDNTEIIELDLNINSNRKDCIEQILHFLTSHFYYNEQVKELFSKIENSNLSPIQKDDIFFKFFEELSKGSYIILIFEYFNNYFSHIKEDDYHRLLQICIKKCKGKISYILLLDNCSSIAPKSVSMNRFLNTCDCSNINYLHSLPSKNIIYKSKNDQNMNQPEVYISYAWEDNSEIILKELTAILTEKNIKYYVDKKDIEYRGNIREFEERLGKGNYIILIISDKFLKSKDCMYEILQIHQNGNIGKRIFPIVLEGTKIYESIDRIQYICYWEEKIKELEEGMKKISAANLDGIRKDIDNFTKIRAMFDSVTTLFKEMNTLSVKIHKSKNYSTIIDQIQTDFDNTSSEEVENRTDSEYSTNTVSQYGQKSIYIEKNEGNININ